MSEVGSVARGSRRRERKKGNVGGVVEKKYGKGVVGEERESREM